MDKFTNWIKKPQTWGFFVSIAVMAILSLAFFYPDNFQGNSLMQADMQQGAANGQESAAYEAATGQKALWTNSLMSGMPTFQISPSYPSNSLFNWLNVVYGLGLPSPSNLLFMMMLGFLILLYCMKVRWWLALIGAIAWGFSSYFVIIIGAGHIWKFITLTYIPPTIGGLILCYRKKWLAGGAMVALFGMLQLNANHPQMTYYFLFVILGIALAYLWTSWRDNKVKHWAIASVIALGAALLAVGANLPSLYNTYEYSKETKRSQSELTPIADDTAEPGTSVAERPTGGLPKAEIVNWSYGREEMLSLLIPNIKGGATAKPEKGQMYATNLDLLEAAKDAPYDVRTFLPAFSQYFNDSEGTNGPVYVGAIICALFLLGCIIVKGPMKWALLILTLLSIFLSLGRNFSVLTDFMIYNFPMYSKFRAVESILVVAEFTMPLLAIMALVKYFKPAPKENAEQMREYKSKALYIAFGLCGFLCLISALVPQLWGKAITSQDIATMNALAEQYPEYINPQRMYAYISDLRYGMLSADAWRSLLFLALGFVVLWLQARKKLSRPVTAFALMAFVTVDLYGVDKRYIDHESFVPYSPFAALNNATHTPDAIDQQILKDQSLSYRVMDIPGFGSADRSYFHKMIGGYHAAKLNRYEDLIQRRMSYVINLPRIAQMLGTNNLSDIIELVMLPDSILQEYPEQLQAMVYNLEADLKVLDMLNAKYLITGDKDQPIILNPDALGNAWFVSSINYVDNADKEMEALSTLQPAVEAVADKKFQDVLKNVEVVPDSSDYITLTSYAPNALSYQAKSAHGGVAVFSEIYFPWGWKATIDGEPAQLGRVNYTLRALRVPAGEHEISMVFDPNSLHVTGSIAYACVSLIYLWIIAAVGFAYIRKEKEAGANGVD